MHEPVKNHIEAYLSRSQRSALPAEFTAHLMACGSCREELTAMESQSRLFDLLVPSADVEPRPGFYARVLERIESQRPVSFWSIFLEPAVGRRIAIASMALALLMGVYLFSSEPGTSIAVQSARSGVSAQVLDNEDQPGPVLGAGAEQDRNAVLVNLVTYQEQ